MSGEGDGSEDIIAEQAREIEARGKVARALAGRLRHAEAEVARLRRGEFTPEELQGICHNLTAEDKEAFGRGCLEYQRQLFGSPCEDPRVARVREVLAWAEAGEREMREGGPRDLGRLTRYGTMGEARALAEAARRLREALEEGGG